MNLIEQLGGYDNAKKFINGECADGFDVQSLRDDLLEYRRQHNIFEVEDICKISTKHDYGLYKFLRKRDDRIYLQDRLGFAEFGIASSSVYHATPEEIKAGRRL